MKRKIRRGSASSQINVTNLVDVSLTLVVIFILTAPLLKEGIAIDVPETTSSEELSSDEEPIIVDVSAERTIYVNERECPEDTVGQRVKAEHIMDRNRTVLLKADAGLDYGFVIHVMDEIRNAGVKKISLVTERKHDGGQREKQ